MIGSEIVVAYTLQPRYNAPRYSAVSVITSHVMDPNFQQ